MRRLSSLTLLLLCACPATPEPPHFLWSSDAQSLDNPFPDERLIVDGKAALRKGWYRPFFPEEKVTPKSNGYFSLVARQAAAEVTSFGNFGATLIPASEKLDASSLHGHVARLVKDDNGWRVLEREVTVEAPSEILARANQTLPEGWPEYLITRPSVPMPEGKEGLLVILKGPKTASGEALGVGSEFDKANTIEDGALSALGVKREDVLYYLPLRAGDVSTAMRGLASWAKANPPAITIPAKSGGSAPKGVWRNTDADWSELKPWLEQSGFSRPASHVGMVVIGSFAAHDLREDEHVKPEWVANPSQAPLVPLQFAAVFPVGPIPAGGWPMVIAQHGVSAQNVPTSGSQAFCMQWAELLAQRGMACIGIDEPKHGTRGNFIEFFSLEDLPAIRDRFREMTFDLLELEQVAVQLDIDGDGTPDVAPRLRYFGNSLGSIMGSNFLPFSDRVDTAMLNVPGGGLSNLTSSAYLHTLLGTLLAAQTDHIVDSPEYNLSFSLLKAAGQPFFDPGDPINVAPLVPARIAILQQAGKGDLIIPNDTEFDLKNAFGLPDAVASSGTTPIRAWQFVDPADFLNPVPDNYNPHGIMWDIAPVRLQAVDFLAADGKALTVP